MLHPPSLWNWIFAIIIHQHLPHSLSSVLYGITVLLQYNLSLSHIIPPDIQSQTQLFAQSSTLNHNKQQTNKQQSIKPLPCLPSAPSPAQPSASAATATTRTAHQPARRRPIKAAEATTADQTTTSQRMDVEDTTKCLLTLSTSHPYLIVIISFAFSSIVFPIVLSWPWKFIRHIAGVVIKSWLRSQIASSSHFHLRRIGHINMRHSVIFSSASHRAHQYVASCHIASH